MTRTLKLALAATSILAVTSAASNATQPALLRNVAAGSLALSEEARQALAGYHLKDVSPVNDIVPDIVFDNAILRFNAARAVIDARVISIFFINRARYTPPSLAATTTQAIDAWTNAVILGAPSGYGTSVDQWVAMAYYLGPRF